VKIIHVTEALGGGVAHYLSQLARAQAADGHEVVLVHSVRSDTPLEVLEALFPAPIKRAVLPMVTRIAPLADLRAFRQLRTLLKHAQPDVLHVHSSKAGVLGRVAAISLGMQARTFYSPHGFAFLREDISPARRQLFLSLERAVGRLGNTLLACSATELDLAQRQVGHARACLVENSIDLGVVPVCRASESIDGRVRVMTSGRICYQKAPWRFAALAEACTDLPADFVWLGDGDLRDALRVDGQLPSQLTISGWQTREAVYASLSVADIFVMPSLWEGMPLALIEAQAAGLPAVVSDVVGNRDVVIDGETGFVCKDDQDLLQTTRRLIEDPALRLKMGRAARERALSRFSVERMHRELMAAYQQSMAK
jgi:glycosyltransferase involved in cell wall biosynthesis